MTKDEYTKALQKWEDDNAQAAEDNGYGSGYSDALQQAITLVEKLDKPKKVVIPQSVDDLIEETTEFYGNDPLNIAYGIASSEDMDADCIDWLDDDDNQKLLLNAIANGYEVEKETKYQILLPGFQTDKGDPYVVARTNKGSWYAVADLKWDNTKFTSEELKQAPEWVQQLKPEEVEDD